MTIHRMKPLVKTVSSRDLMSDVQILNTLTPVKDLGTGTRRAIQSLPVYSSIWLLHGLLQQYNWMYILFVWAMQGGWRGRDHTYKRR
jgi:hypothetical protein